MKVRCCTTIVIGACCLLAVNRVLQAAPVSLPRPLVTGRLPSTDNDLVKYSKLQEAIREWQHREILIEELQINSHCPFQVFREGNVTRILCDIWQMRNCTNDKAHCKDVLDNCFQAYDLITEFRSPVEVGCIYHPKGIGMSVEAISPDQYIYSVQ